jgi:hypothetical protein
MPPEQAAGRTKEVGAHSDIYALGAILYELLTARPPFRAETPLDTLLLVLNSDPVSPRLLNPGVPRDLETICLKCLAKESSKRYATAAELVDDLERFQRGDPIQARRPGITERCVRWGKKQRRSVILSLAASSLAVLLLLASISVWFGYQEWRRGFVTLDTDGQVLMAQVFDTTGGPAAPRFTIPTQEPVPLPAGSYHMLVSGTGILSRNYQLLVERGQEHQFSILTKEHSTTPPIGIPRTFEVARLDGRRDDIVLISELGLQRLNGASRNIVWEMKFDSANQQALTKLPQFSWNWLEEDSPSGRGLLDRRPMLVRMPPQQPDTGDLPDLNRDGEYDLVWALRHQAAVVAICGKTGQVLWGVADEKSLSTGAVLRQPCWADVDGDAVPDLIAAFATTDQQPQESNGGKQWVEAISGSDGHTVWRADLHPDLFQIVRGTEIPISARWLTNYVPESYTGGVGHGAGSHGVWSLEIQQPAGPVSLVARSIVVPGKGHAATV